MFVHELMYQGEENKTAFTGSRNVSYGELQAMVLKYRNFFWEQGVRAGDNVGLLAKNSPEFVYSYFAVVSLGAVVVPLNFQLVSREIAYIVQDAKIKILVTMNKLSLAEELNGYGYVTQVNQLVIPEFSAAIAKSEGAAAPIIDHLDIDQACVIIYTSGTTGKPKGALLTHRNLISNASAFMEVLPVTANDHVLCVLPMYHCFAWTCSVLASLLRGASIRIVETFAIREVLSTIREERITIIYAVPAMFNLFLNWGTARDFDKVNFLVSGGSALPEKIADGFYRKFNKRITEGYGLSEASPVVALNPIDKVKYCSIGKPLPGINVRLVDGTGQDVAVGQVGELIVQGPNVMQGYYNLSAETREALKDGWLHTGDLAYCDQEGYLYIVDRLKDMLITSGENVYPREIEELLYAYPGILEAAVIGVPDKMRGQAGCAYVVFKEGYSLNKKSLREYLQANLAAYKVPKEFMQLDALPKNSTGKIMKTVLREQTMNRVG